MPEEVQLYYQIARARRATRSALAPDEYAGFTMTLLRMLAFAPATAKAPERPRLRPGVARPVLRAPK